MTPTISAILPNYNYANFFVSRLNSILEQTCPVSEIIILDDASTDDSVKIIKQEIKKQKKAHPNINFIFSANSTNSGNVFSQWKNGIELATSDYIWIAEIDDSCEPNFLEEVIKPLEKNQKVVLSYSNSKLIGDVTKKDIRRQRLDFLRRRHLPGKYTISGKRELNRNLAVFNSIPNVSACVFRNIPELTDFLSLSKNYHLSGDWFFYTKIAENGKIAYNPKKLNLHRLSKESVTSQTDLEKRYKELKRIHSEITLNNNLHSSTLSRIEKSEKKLKKNWEI